MSQHQTDISVSLSFEHNTDNIKAKSIVQSITELITERFSEEDLETVLCDYSIEIENSVCIENEPPDDTYNDS